MNDLESGVFVFDNEFSSSDSGCVSDSSTTSKDQKPLSIDKFLGQVVGENEDIEEEKLSHWKSKLGEDVQNIDDLAELVAAKQTWASIDIPPLFKARIENFIRNHRQQESSQEKEQKLEFDDKWQELSQPHHLQGLYQKSGNLQKTRSIVVTLRKSRFFSFFEIFQFLVAILACIIFAFSTYYHTPPGWTRIFFFLVGIIFCTEFIIYWLVSQQLLYYLTTKRAIVDVVTIVPLFIPLFGTYKLYWLISICSLRTYRVVRALRDLGCFKNRGFRIPLLEILVIAFSFIYFSACIFVYAEGLAFHTSLYFIIVSFTTVGYGDISPITFWGRFAITALLVCLFIIVPLQTDLIVETINTINTYGGTYREGLLYKPPFIVLTGDIDEFSLENFLEEFYHKNHASYFQYHRVVVLHPKQPSDGIKTLLRVKYRHQLRYYTGSPLVEKDLDRVKARSAKAIYILSVYEESRYSKKDRKSIIEALSIRKYDANAPTILQIQCQDSLPIALLADPTLVICTQQIKLYSCKKFHCTGFTNLIGEFDTCIQPAFIQGPPKLDERIRNIGECQQLFKYNLPAIFSDYCFATVCKFFYRKYGALIIAIKESWDKDRCVVSPHPQYKFTGDEILFIVCESYGTIRLLERIKNTFDNLTQQKVHYLDDLERANIDISERWDEEHQSLPMTWNPLPEYECQKPKSYEDAIRHDVRHLSDHIILTGPTAFLSYDLPVTMKQPNGSVPAVVLFNTEKPSEKQWMVASRRAIVFIVEGSALNKEDLKRAGVETAKLFVVTNDKDPSSNQKSTDMDSVIAFLAVVSMRPSLDVRLELTSSNTLKLFKDKSLASSKYNRLLPQYASGQLFLADIAENLSVQAFYNPDILDLVHQILGIHQCESFLSIRNIPEYYHGGAFEELFEDMICKNALIIGLYRYNEEGEHYYVYTKPPLNTVIRNTDKVRHAKYLPNLC